MPCCTVLCCTMLCCTVLCCMMLYCTMLCCTALLLCCTVLCWLFTLRSIRPVAVGVQDVFPRVLPRACADGLAGLPQVQHRSLPRAGAVDNCAMSGCSAGSDFDCGVYQRITPFARLIVQAQLACCHCMLCTVCSVTMPHPPPQTLTPVRIRATPLEPSPTSASTLTRRRCRLTWTPSSQRWASASPYRT